MRTLLLLFLALTVKIEARTGAHEDKLPTNILPPTKRSAVDSSTNQPTKSITLGDFAPCGESIHKKFKTCGKYQFQYAYVGTSGPSLSYREPLFGDAKCQLLVEKKEVIDGRIVTRVSQVLPRGAEDIEKRNDSLDNYTIIPGFYLGPPFQAGVNYMVLPFKSPGMSKEELNSHPPRIIPAPCDLQPKGNSLGKERKINFGLALKNSANEERARHFESIPDSCNEQAAKEITKTSDIPEYEMPPELMGRQPSEMP